MSWSPHSDEASLGRGPGGMGRGQLLASEQRASETLPQAILEVATSTANP